MKKFISALSIASYLAIAPSAFAATISTCASNGQFSALCAFDASSFSTIVGTVIQLIFAIAIIVALLYLIWGGFKWLTSGGDKQAVASAREHIIAALIGLVIIFLSYFILNILVGFFIPGANISTINIPSI